MEDVFRVIDLSNNFLGHFTLLTTYSFSVHLPLPTPNTMLMFIQSISTIPIFLGGTGLGKLNNDFPFQKNSSAVVILSSVPRKFGQDCRYSRRIYSYRSVYVLLLKDDTHMTPFECFQ